jgi:hypothetical protein
MRTLLLAAALAALTSAANAEDWIAVCYGQDAQYTQTVGGKGYFHVANNNGTYDTQKLVQSHYDGNILCGTADPKAPRALSEVSEVCADKTKKTISVMFLSDTAHPVTPGNAKPYCAARVGVY